MLRLVFLTAFCVAFVQSLPSICHDGTSMGYSNHDHLSKDLLNRTCHDTLSGVYIICPSTYFNLRSNETFLILFSNTRLLCGDDGSAENDLRD